MCHILSAEYKLECGVSRGIISPKLFNLYVNELIGGLSSMHARCYVGSTCINNLNYADDMVLLSPSVNAFTQMLETCKEHAMVHGLEYNPEKSEVMVFKAGKIKPYYIPPIMLNRLPLKVTDKVKYLGHILTSDLNYDLDVKRQRRALALPGHHTQKDCLADESREAQYYSILNAIAGRYDCPILKHWIVQVKGVAQFET
ncbi:uncharacterized protein LOC113238347 [Hyposmocoma kahamanoa]|uniref:uncharacterized protein LOC113238347 n=1 Tax=Hyposmocoma kahamanoa TaxID=1477025 RepID=UPI000E6D9C31|nr:uncharacterized protein LOC113238347 [Hyposmocoma kahamanoa]